MKIHLPDRQDAASLGKSSFLLDTSNSLLKNRGDLGGSSLAFGGVGAGLDGGSVGNDGCGISGLRRKKNS